MPVRGLAALTAWLFPSRCIGCGARGAVVCAACRPLLPWLDAAACPGCALVPPRGAACQRCRQGPMPCDGVRAAFRYEGAARRAILDLKFRGIRDRADLLGDALATAIERRPVALDLVAPVPLTVSRERWRGFNQSALIAAVVGKRLGLLVAPHLLTRVRDTAPQVGKSGADRRQNVVSAFCCADASAVDGLRVGVIDDVMTTGSTLAACADALRAAGAARIYGLVVARDL